MHFKFKMSRYVTADRSIMKHYYFAFGTGLPTSFPLRDIFTKSLLRQSRVTE